MLHEIATLVKENDWNIHIVFYFVSHIWKHGREIVLLMLYNLHYLTNTFEMYKYFAAPLYLWNKVNQPPIVSFHFMAYRRQFQVVVLLCRSEGIEVEIWHKFANVRTNLWECIQCAADVQNGT